ncbi:hypothetical protein DXG03_008162 [Asterophora parasitica]|uniref:Uncharacterized protein n=1 Tax=Asterophora parasitica TaxID=117018 RepID=A0A9P7G6S5_9AGAR|nr:hypothetical protein DXG03_008162 [Asterophora parasitica]
MPQPANDGYMRKVVKESIVYHATERDSGRAVALKKSRVSLRVKRSILKHEARVHKLLSGHPSIPQVFASILESKRLGTSPDPRHHDARMCTDDIKFFAQVSALTSVHVTASGDSASTEHAIDGTTEHEWFDERVRATS